ncbi:MAG: hypothetical protein ISR58_07800 [Anaerolineales bacterium]|nr:hypothetical protein [Chloroflexota bacterium]MBL6981080.1 hypothetical protein [Anaerolineales bacterium]
MKQDRVLIAILVVIFILITLSLTLFFIRRGDVEYGTDISPEGVVRNYVLALHKEDYQRAHNYLQDADEKPSMTEFRNEFMGLGWNLEDTGLQLGETEISGDEAVVRLTIIHGGSEPFGSSWSETNDAWLVQQKGEWKLSYMPYPYWGWEWYVETDQ